MYYIKEMTQNIISDKGINYNAFHFIGHKTDSDQTTNKFDKMAPRSTWACRISDTPC